MAAYSYARAGDAANARHHPSQLGRYADSTTTMTAPGYTYERRRQYVASAHHSQKTAPTAYDAACELERRSAASYNAAASGARFNASSQYRSQSHETLSSSSSSSSGAWHRDQYTTPSAAQAPPYADRKVRRYGRLGADQETACVPERLLPSVYQRRDSESSTYSTTSSSTASNTDSPPRWSGSESESEATTPGSASPISPNSSLLLLSDSPSPERISPPQRSSSKMNPVAAALSPSRPQKPQQPSMPIRPVRPRAYSRPSRFQSTPIESPVPEETEEQGGSRRLSRTSQNLQQHQQLQQRQQPQQHQQAYDDTSVAPSLHQRRQQRQQMLSSTTEQPPVRQPVPQKLSPLYPLPLQLQRPPQPPSTLQPRLKASRSLPQLRNPAGPPPAMPLPPLPQIPTLSPFLPPTPTYSSWSAKATTPPTTSPTVRPPAPPALPPPPPPSANQQQWSSGPAIRKPLPTSSTETTLKASSTTGTITPETASRPSPPGQEEAQKMQAQNYPEAWEAEFQRQRVFLKQFSSPPEEPREQERPRLSRTYRSLGNLRAHSKSLSRVTGAAAPKPGTGGDAPRLITAKSMRDLKSGRLEEGLPLLPPMPPLPAVIPVAPVASSGKMGPPPLPVSVFEDDSDDEEGNDAVRRFVRNLFGRRTRSAEVHDASARMAAATMTPAQAARSASLGDARTKSGYFSNNGSHNSRAKNQSTASSTLSMATTVGASTVASSTGTAVTAQSSNTTDSYGRDSSECGTASPRESCERPPSTAKEQHFLGRMFVRRSN